MAASIAPHKAVKMEKLDSEDDFVFVDVCVATGIATVRVVFDAGGPVPPKVPAETDADAADGSTAASSASMVAVTQSGVNETKVELDVAVVVAIEIVVSIAESVADDRAVAAVSKSGGEGSPPWRVASLFLCQWISASVSAVGRFLLALTRVCVEDAFAEVAVVREGA
ncbi:uncharacterized protein IUM83_05899 [Phytophthora cinnamomi]|uniref:uncharacterized protein n=1 Tax=Phytophthora cinnamomi TaxID=4785 RepID=UPI0035596960|nr:hypothetical protein IUM83_05899 [Phytophthora cinnamomi]